MTIRKIALGACLLVSGTALAQDRTYTVRQGDTLSEIAGKFGVDTKAILHANHLPTADKLKLGQKLRIPAAEGSKPEVKPTPGEGYAVQSGDNDEVIAKRLGVTPKELRLANLGTNWTKLQIGQRLSIPTTKNWFNTMANHAVAKAQNQRQTEAPVAQLISNVRPVTTEAPKSKIVQRTYTVRNGDNDWIIARRVGIKPSQLRTLNPGTKWGNLQIGTELKVPGTKVVSPVGQVVAQNEPNLPKIRSRYAVITGDRVTLRRGPSMRFDSLTQVDQGTRVMVLDREGSWYKLRFPRGTEAWVRGDFLAPTTAPQMLVASNTKKKNTSAKKASSKPTYVASRPNRKPSRDQRGGLTRRPTRDNGRPLVSGSLAGGDAVEKASSMIGVRYRYGAASRGATDCSGLTTQVYKSMGVKLPRTAREQSSRGQKVDKNGLKAGDLVFFKTRGSRVSHVGIYKGNGKFIHASSGKGRVMESSLNEGYYNRRYAGARRIVASKPASKKADVKVAKKEEPKSTPVDPVTTPVEPKTSTAPPENSGK